MIRAALLALLVLAVGCSRKGGGESPGPSPADMARVPVSELKVVRSYGWDATVEDPQPAWNPETYEVVARSAQGIAVLQEGRDRQRYFKAESGRDYHDPQWLTRTRLLLSPPSAIERDDDGRPILPSDGLDVVEVTRQGLKNLDTLVERGYRAQPWRGREGMVAQWGEEILLVGAEGEAELFEMGFDPAPQPGGTGFAWRDRPLHREDLWSGREGVGDLFVRWDDGQVTTIHLGAQPSWTAGGGIVATVLGGELSEEHPFGGNGAQVVHLAGPDAEFSVVMAGAHSPAAHPKADLVALRDHEGGLRITNLDGVEELVVSEGPGGPPLWSADGRRLLTVDRSGRVPRIVVHVIRRLGR